MDKTYNYYLAVLENDTKRALQLIRLTDAEYDNMMQGDEDAVAAAHGIDLNNCEWMAGEMEININI
jgi:hypothetical protein